MLTAGCAIRREILLSIGTDYPPDTAEQIIDDAWNAALEDRDSFGLDDARSEFRGGFDCETPGIPCAYSRHYEAKGVAKKLSDGRWVGWIYWYGGGKHGDPESIEWMDEAYHLDVTEEKKVMTVRTFRRH